MVLLVRNNKGFSLLELVITLAIFGFIIVGIINSFNLMATLTVKEQKASESGMEFVITKNFMERDILTAGYGLADDYDYDGDGNQNFQPRSVGALDSNPDEFTLMGTALGRASRTAQAITYIDAVLPTFRVWNDSLEDLQSTDRVILMEPSTKALIAESNEWLFNYNGSATNVQTTTGGVLLTAPAVGTIVYGLHSSSATEATQPYSAVRYYLGGTSPSNCAAGTQSLLRAESRTTENPVSGDPLLACVLDLQVAFALDANEDGTIETWDDGGVLAATYDRASLRRRIRQVRAYVLVQIGSYDSKYNYPSSFIDVGDTSIGTGRTFLFTTAQRKYKWKVITLYLTPRNME